MAIGPVPPYVTGGPLQLDFLQPVGDRIQFRSPISSPDLIQLINVGSSPGDQTGDPGRLAWQKANLDFTILDKRTNLYAGPTANELAGNVPIINPRYAPGDILRYGADLTGTNDSSQAIINALRSIPSGGGNEGGRVFCSQGGIITVNALVQLDAYSAYSDWTLDFTGVEIHTTLTSGNIFQLGDATVKDPAQNFIWSGGYFHLSGNNVTAIAVYRCQNIKFENVWVFNALNSFKVDGTICAPNGRIISVKFDNCYSGQATIGYYFNAQNPQTGSYTGIKMDTCASESDATGISYQGFPSQSFATLHMDNCEVQNSTVAGVIANQCLIEINSGFAQTSSPTTVPSINAQNGAVVHVRNGDWGYPVIDASSFVWFDQGTANELINTSSTSRLSGGALGDLDSVGWGPPNYPTGKTGHHALLGYQWRDSMGVDWVCTVAGQTGGSSPFVKYMPLNDPCEIIIPCAIGGNIANGALLWFPQMDFIVEEVLFLVTTAFTGASGVLSFSAGTVNQQGLISQDADQGAVANLTLGKLVTSRRNRNSLAQLTGGNTLFWSGNEYNATSGTVGVNGIYSITSSMTAGAGRLIIRGYRPRVTTAGAALSGAVLPSFTQSPGSTTQVLYNNGGAVAGASGLTYGANGNVAIADPSSGNSLTVSATGSHVGVLVQAASGTNAIQGGSSGNNIGIGTNVGLSGSAENIYGQSAAPLAIGTTGAQSLNLYTNSALRVSINSTGDITARGIAVCKRATAIETRSSTTTLTNSTQLTYAIPAAGTYAFEIVVFSYFTTAVTDGITANVNYSGTFTAVGSYLYGDLMNGTTTTLGIQPVEISATVNNALAGLTMATYGASVAAATPAAHFIKVNLIATGTGTLAFAFAQSTSGVDTTNLGVGSWMTVTQLS
jgi:hypothetical protein